MKQAYIFFILLTIAGTYIPKVYAKRQYSHRINSMRSSTFHSRPSRSFNTRSMRGTTRLSTSTSTKNFNTGLRSRSHTRRSSLSSLPTKTKAGFYSRPDRSYSTSRHDSTHRHRHRHSRPIIKNRFSCNGGGFGDFGGYGGYGGWGGWGFGFGWGPYWGWGPGWGGSYGYGDQAPSTTYIINDQRTCANCPPKDYSDDLAPDGYS